MLLMDQIDIDSQYDRHVSAGIAKVWASVYLFPLDILDTAARRARKFDGFFALKS